MLTRRLGTPPVDRNARSWRTLAAFALLLCFAAPRVHAQRAPTVGPPAPSYLSLPGWLVFDVFGTPRGGSFAIYPEDARWRHVDARTTLMLVTGNGTAPVHLQGVPKPDDDWNATVVGVRAEKRFKGARFAWLLPAKEATGAAQLLLREATTRDSTVRTWTAGPARLRLRKTGRQSAELWADRGGAPSLLVDRITVDAKADADMGVDSDSVLTLSNWRMPVVVAAFRLGATGPIAIVYRISGYECQNFLVIAFHPTRIEHLDEPHYYECSR